MGRADWCLERSKIYKAAAELDADALRKLLLLQLAQQWALAANLARQLNCCPGTTPSELSH
jgi:hypothetical protein